MAAESRNPGAVVASAGEKENAPELYRFRKLLEDEPFRVRFFQAVRMMQRLEPDRTPVGYFVPPSGEAIRFSSLPTLNFPPNQIDSIRRNADGQYQMTVQFMGLSCGISVLPAPYTEHLLGLIRDKNRAMADFFDIFNHRMVSFFYRGWEKYRFYIGCERGSEDPVAPRMMDLLGLGAEGLATGLELPETALMHYVGLLGRQTRSAEALRKLLEGYFEVPVAIEQFVGTWRSLPADNQTRFSGLGGPSEQLGVGVVAGSEVLDMHGRIRVAIGPMRFERYIQFLPGQSASRELAAWIRFYASGNYEAEVQLILDRRDAPGCELGGGGRLKPQLGYVSWLKTKPMTRNPADATYLIE